MFAIFFVAPILCLCFFLC